MEQLLVEQYIVRYNAIDLPEHLEQILRRVQYINMGYKRGSEVKKCLHICTYTIHTGFVTGKFTMATSASNELDLKKISFAFSPEERALGSSLENDLHPLYRRFNFRASALTADTTLEDGNEPFLEAQVYERMVPALRLASLLLEFSLPFYTKVFCADIIFVGQQYAFNPTYECTNTDIQRTRDLLVEVSTRTRFYCRTPFVAPASPNHETVLGFSEVRTGGGPFPTPAHSLISIGKRTNDFFSQDGYGEIDAETKTSQLVQLAFVLVHEQAHAIFNHKWAEDPELSNDERDFVRRVAPREPMYHMQMDHRYYELGFALQAWIHGGSILSRGQHLIFVEYPDDVFSERTDVENYNFRGILLSADFWQAVRDTPRPSDYWNKSDAPKGWLGRAIADYASRAS